MGQLCGDQAVAKQCYLVAHQARQTHVHSHIPIDGLDVRDELAEERGKPVEDLMAVPLEDGNPDHFFQIGLELDSSTRQKLVLFL